MIEGYVPTCQPAKAEPDVGAYLAARFTWVRRTGDKRGRPLEEWLTHWEAPHGSS